ncbi:MAG: glycosyltransferase family 2 protein [Elusimicrobia bacterium]|nr:glycosyltransferase family 2 protein [Elusimicrobiota bacterium]
MNLPSVSIIIPTYKRPEFLLRALDSVLGQDYQNIKEIIITDDGDYEESFIEKLKAEDSRIIYVKNTKYAKGPSGNKQNGLDIASGDFIAFMDDDDELFNDAVSSVMKVLITGSYKIAFANCVRSDNGKFTGKHYDRDEEASYWDFICGKYEGEYWGINSYEIMKKIRFKDEYGGAEGLAWLGLYKEENIKLKYIHKAVRKYYVHENQFSNTYEQNALRTFNSYEKYLELFGEDIIKTCPKKYSYICKIASYFAFLSGNKQKISYYAAKSFMSDKSFLSFIFYLFSICPLSFYVLKYYFRFRKK